MDNKKNDILDAVNQRFIVSYLTLRGDGKAPNLKDFCKAVGIAYSNWSKFEKGSRFVDLANVVLLTSQYDISPAYLLHNEGPIRDEQQGDGTSYQTTVEGDAGIGSIGTNNGNATVHYDTTEDCLRKLSMANAHIQTLEARLLEKENALLEKDHRIQDKDRIIELLEMALKK